MSRVDIYDNLFMWDLGCHMIRWSKPYKKGDLSIVASSAVLGGSALQPTLLDKSL